MAKVEVKAKRKPGRPSTGNAKTNAERQQKFRIMRDVRLQYVEKELATALDALTDKDHVVAKMRMEFALKTLRDFLGK